MVVISWQKISDDLHGVCLGILRFTVDVNQLFRWNIQNLQMAGRDFHAFPLLGRRPISTAVLACLPSVPKGIVRLPCVISHRPTPSNPCPQYPNSRTRWLTPLIPFTHSFLSFIILHNPQDLHRKKEPLTYPENVAKIL